MPSISLYCSTMSWIGTATSNTRRPNVRLCTTSFATAASPPRVTSRMNRTPGATSSTRSIRPFRGATSDSSSTPSSSPSRRDITAMPWSPSVPFTSTLSPGRIWSTPSVRPSGTKPMPAVFTNSPSPLPRCSTFVSPATMAMPASSAVAFIERTTRSSSSIS